MREDQKLVTIARFESEFEAKQAKIILDSEGIHAVILGESLGMSFPDISKIDFVELQVFEEDRRRAEELLEQDADISEEEQDELL